MIAFDKQQLPALHRCRPRGPACQQLLLRFGTQHGALALLQRVQAGWRAGGPLLGLSFRGLQRLGLPRAYQQLFARLAPAFREGAPPRASLHLGDHGPSSAARWAPAWQLDNAHALLSLQGPADALLQALPDWLAWLDALAIRATALPLAAPLDSPGDQPGEFVHFGLRDGLSQPAIAWPDDATPPPDAESPGEFITGFLNSAGYNPFALPLAPPLVRAFFAHGSFAALRQMAQRLQAFEQQVAQLAAASGRSAAWVKAKLLGRWPHGAPFTGDTEPPAPALPERPEHQRGRDADGLLCPFGAHIRRMNPPPGSRVHARRRPLLRRGLPYGAADWQAATPDAGAERGLLGLFVCSSLEDQFEHLLGQWAARVPLGSPDGGTAKDPLIGNASGAGGLFEVPQAGGPLQWGGWQDFVQTRGTCYLFYPGQFALQTLIEGSFAKEDGPWLPER